MRVEIKNRSKYKMPFSFAKIISEPKSILYKDLAEPVPSELFFEITITGLLNWSKILLATIPITPGCQFSELTIITLFLFCLYACSFASFKIFSSINFLFSFNKCNFLEIDSIYH